MSQGPVLLNSWAQPIRGVAFDMDGLLVNTEELYTQVGNAILHRRGKVFSHQLKNAMTGLPGPKAFALMIEREGLTDSVEQLQCESATLFADILPNQLKLLVGVVELLATLTQEKLPRCVATSSSPDFARQVLSQVGIIDQFDFIITAHDVKQGKPHPEIYCQAAQRMDVSPTSMLVLEDSHHGCCAGVASGACTVAVPGPHSEDHDFTGVHYRARSLLDPGIRRLIFGSTQDPVA